MSGFRLQIAWLTAAGLAVAILVGALQPAGGVIPLHYSRDASSLAQALSYPSLSILNAARADLAADMMFLLVYGFLLRRSAMNLGLRVAATLAFVLMAADALENISTLRILSLFEFDRGNPSLGALFPFMNAFSVAKWFTGCVVLGMVGVGWFRHRLQFSGFRRKAALAVAILFALGAAGSLSAALGFWVSALRAGALAALAAPALAFILQAWLGGDVPLILRFIYFVRVPLVSLLIIAAFGPLAFGPGKALLGGILEVEGGARAVLLITFAALLVSAACLTQINLVRDYAADRMHNASLEELKEPPLGVCLFWISVSAALSLAISTAAVATNVGLATAVWSISGGALAAFIVVFAAEWLTARISRPLPGKARPVLALPFRGSGAISRVLDDAYCAPPPPGIAAVKAKAAAIMRPSAVAAPGNGYFEATPTGSRLAPGHSFALTLAFLSLVVYVWLIFSKLSSVESGGPPAIPTLVAILCLVLLASWVLSALTFFLDAYRVPLAAGALLLALLTGLMGSGDFVFPIAVTGANAPLKTPGEVLRSFIKSGKLPVAIATAGGGIQAGAWTMRVLRSLDEAGGGPGNLRGRVAVLSAVSGGSMGALYYGAFQNDPNLQRAEEASRASSLDEVASALAGPDVLHAVLGPARKLFMSPEMDRGLALETTWRWRMPASQRTRSLANWAAQAGSNGDGGLFPAFLFNATVVESGAPVAFATTQIPSAAYRHSLAHTLSGQPVVENYASLYKISDGTSIDTSLLAATAARLSAAFPYVSPASAPADPDPRRPHYHVVDGGYYDNYGLIGLTQWLDDAFEELAASHELPAHLAIVVIRGPFPGDATAKSQGWLDQLTDPPSAYLATRTYAQWAGGGQAVKLLLDKWAGKIDIQTLRYEYPIDRLRDTYPECTEPPLNWKLTPLQKNCIDKALKLVAASGDSGLTAGIK